ncbi:MAG TPA: hypothetical protein VEA80_11600 [Vitreimonas sp.]|uniref:hypothetical protein n=1 Tax=Vitreimonas sp. TaxID=3069702 RepID=UPI002D274C08|nr:hypothetical protein [Vitreimonas sp.]HYD88113.1 hypothetical protein [Vitreimonas sp.]
MSSSVVTTDHEEIRAWVEENNGRPARVRGTGDDEDDAGLLRIDFDAAEEGLEEIEWDDWFEGFEENNLALLHATNSRFNKLISRDSAS